MGGGCDRLGTGRVIRFGLSILLRRGFRRLAGMKLVFGSLKPVQDDARTTGGSAPLLGRPEEPLGSRINPRRGTMPAVTLPKTRAQAMAADAADPMTTLRSAFVLQ